MKTTNPPAPQIIISVTPLLDDAIDIVKLWLVTEGYTGNDVRVRKNEDGVWAELKEGAVLR